MSKELYSFTLGQNGCHFAGDIFKCIFMNANFRILIQISLNFVPKGPICSKSALVHVMPWCRTGAKPLPEPMARSISPTHICGTRGQRFKYQSVHLQVQ